MKLYSIDEEYNYKDRDKYIAAVNDKNSKKEFFVKLEDKNSSKDQYSYLEFLPECEITPMLHECQPSNKQRDVVVVFGASGSGKSYLVNQMCSMYKRVNPDRKIYFITNNNYERDDSLTHSLYEFIKLKDLLAHYANPENLSRFESNNDFDNSLIVADDVHIKNKEEKAIWWNFVNIIATFKRKNLVSFILTTHEPTAGHDGKILYNEMTGYVMYSLDLKNRSSRVLRHYLKLTNEEVERLMDSNSRWNYINTRAKTVINQREIYKLK